MDQMSIGEFARDSRLSAKALRDPVQRSATRMTTVVTAESLTKRFGGVSAVTDVSFALEAGTITGFLGPNGAGKTTTLRMILGLVAPTSGRALVFDHPYAELPRAALRIGAVLEATDFHPGRSGRDHLRMLGQAVDVPDSRADEVLRLVDLGDAAHRRVKGYSLGMRQRLGLAAALLGDPELLILDEPANGLDPEGVRWLRDFLHKLASEGRTVLISSHVLAEIAQTADRVLIISRGQLVLSSSLTELTARAGGAVRVRSGDPQRLTKALRDEALQVTTGTDHALLVQGASSERIGEIAFAAGAALWGAIGAGLGAIIHNQIGAVITLLAWGLVVDDLLFGLAPSVGRFTPTRASDALMGLRVDHLLSPGVGAITLIAWAGALGVLGIALSARQDIN